MLGELKVGAWTVNDPADMARLKGLDADLHRPA